MGYGNKIAILCQKKVALNGLWSKIAILCQKTTCKPNKKEDMHKWIMVKNSHFVPGN